MCLTVLNVLKSKMMRKRGEGKRRKRNGKAVNKATQTKYDREKKNVIINTERGRNRNKDEKQRLK